MLQFVETLALLKNHIEELQAGISANDLQEWKRTAFQLVDALAGPSQAPLPVELVAHARLSPRENEVMQMMLSGRRLKEIAAELGISVKTVTTHRARLLRKLNLSDNLGLYRYGVRSGLVSL